MKEFGRGSCWKHLEMLVSVKHLPSQANEAQVACKSLAKPLPLLQKPQAGTRKAARCHADTTDPAGARQTRGAICGPCCLMGAFVLYPRTWNMARPLCAATEHKGDGLNARFNNELLPSRLPAPVLCTRPRPPGCF
eukprot:s5552_g1.t1